MGSGAPRLNSLCSGPVVLGTLSFLTPPAAGYSGLVSCASEVGGIIEPEARVKMAALVWFASCDGNSGEKE